MANMPILRNIHNDTPADAIDVEWNYNTIETYVNTKLIKQDGSVAMTAPLTLQAGDPTDPTHAVNKAYADRGLPPGVMVEFGAGTLPASMVGVWLFCDGSIQTIATYPDLHAVIGSTFNTGGEPAGQFRLPDFRARVAVGHASAAGPLYNSVGYVGGTPDASLIVHSHTASGSASQDTHDHSQWIRDNQGARTDGTGSELVPSNPIEWLPERTSSDSHSHSISVSVNETGIGDGLNVNLQPYIIIGKIIKT